MALITNQRLKDITDKVAFVYEQLSILVGETENLNDITTLTLQRQVNELERLSTQSDDYDIENAFNKTLRAIAENMNAREMMADLFNGIATKLDEHCASLGSTVSSTISSLSTYLDHYNGTTTPLFVVMLDPWFQDFWTFVNGTALDNSSFMQKPIHPDWRNTTYTDAKAMGQRTVGAFTDGYAYDSDYGETRIVAEVTVDFSGGAGAPSFTVNYTDSTGAPQSVALTVTGGNNPTAELSTTITPALTGYGRRTFAVASATGIVPGSIWRINEGLPDEETVLVETVSGTDITAVITKSHNAGATFGGKRTWSTASNIRARDITNIVGTYNGHAAGTIRIVGYPDRVAI